MNLRDWVFKGGKLVKYDEQIWKVGEQSHILSPYEMLKCILLQRKGEEILL